MYTIDCKIRIYTRSWSFYTSIPNFPDTSTCNYSLVKFKDSDFSIINLF